jgi:hypothetical protein
VKAESGRWTLPVELSLEGLDPGAQSVEIELSGFRPTRDPFELRVFLAQPGASASTPTDGNPRYAGSIFLFGRGDATHEHPEGAPDPLAPMALRVDATDAIRALAAPRFTVTLVAVDMKGREIAAPEIEFDAIALIASEDG